MRKLYGTFRALSSERNHLSTRNISQKKALPHKRQCFDHAQSGNLCNAFLFLDSCCEHRENFVDIAYDTVVANFEDRSIFVFVDGDDAVRAGHTSQVLNSTGDSAGNVDLRSNGFTRLADLMESADPASVNCAREAPTAPPRTSAHSFRMPVANGSSPFMPRPPETMMSASSILTPSPPILMSSTKRVIMSASETLTSFSITSPVALGSASGFLKTCGRTVPICGRLSLQMISAMMLPPRAGRVQTMVLPSSSTLSCVQSAVRPVFKVLATRGPRSRPMLVAPTRNTLAFSSSKKSQRTFAYAVVL